MAFLLEPPSAKLWLMMPTDSLGGRVGSVAPSVFERERNAIRRRLLPAWQASLLQAAAVPCVLQNAAIGGSRPPPRNGDERGDWPVLGESSARNILVAYDGTATAERAFVKALDVAERDAAELHIRTVIRPKAAPDDIDAKREASLTWRRLLLTRARERGIEANFATVVSESTARGIALEAQRIHAVLIVVGHRHRELCHKWLDTSIATRVVDHALCDVLVVS